MLGEHTYTVGFTAAEGEYKYSYEDKARQLPPPAPESLEALFVRAGYTNAFLDFRSLGPDGAWLRQKLIARPFGYGNVEANWTDIFDGIFFVKRMFGSTKRSTDQISDFRTDKL
jgi:erythromycin esterase-like protein